MEGISRDEAVTHLVSRGGISRDQAGQWLDDAQASPGRNLLRNAHGRQFRLNASQDADGLWGYTLLERD